MHKQQGESQKVLIERSQLEALEKDSKCLAVLADNADQIGRKVVLNIWKYEIIPEGLLYPSLSTWRKTEGKNWVYFFGDDELASSFERRVKQLEERFESNLEDSKESALKLKSSFKEEKTRLEEEKTRLEELIKRYKKTNRSLGKRNSFLLMLVGLLGFILVLCIFN
jgi:hypothetical protein